jgi:hypothetical protein
MCDLRWEWTGMLTEHARERIGFRDRYAQGTENGLPHFTMVKEWMDLCLRHAVAVNRHLIAVWILESWYAPWVYG